MDLPFYLRILPSEALEVLAYYRRRGSNLAYADVMITATGLSERGFGKAIRRLVTKGYLVLDGDQRYRLTEHGQRAVDDLPASMADGGVEGDYDDASEMVDEPEVERVPIDSSDNFDALFGSAEPADDIDSLFDEPDEPIEVDINAERFLQVDALEQDSEAIAALFEDDDTEDEDENEDDLFDELDDEEAAAFEDVFGSADEEDEETTDATASVEAEAEVSDVQASAEANAAPVEFNAVEVAQDAPVEAGLALDDLFADMDEFMPDAGKPPVQDEVDDDEPLSLFETLAEDQLDSFVASPGLPADDVAVADDADFQWLDLDDDGESTDYADLWASSEPASEAVPAADEAVFADGGSEPPGAVAGVPVASRIIGRRLVVALPQPLVAGQPTHVTIGILPDAREAVTDPLPLVVKLAVVNGEPARTTELPMLLTNGLARQDVTVTPGRYRQVRLRLQVYQQSDVADEAISCGGMYVDADVVAEEAQQTPVAFGADTHFFVDP